MNKKIIYFFMLAMSLTLFAGCGDDDDDPAKDPDYATQVAATYNGQLTVNVPGADPITQPNAITISRSDVNKVKLELTGLVLPLGKTPVPLGDIAVDGIAVSKNGNDIVMAEKTTTVSLPIGISADVTVSEGKVTGNTLSFNIDVMAPGGLAVNVTFTGTK